MSEGNGAPELGLELLGVEAEAFAATPTLNLRIGLRRLDGGPVGIPHRLADRTRRRPSPAR